MKQENLPKGATPIDPDESVLRFHHRLVQIHCFPYGNGRHSRHMTDMLLTDILGNKSFSWGNGNLSTKGDTRDTFIDAL